MTIKINSLTEEQIARFPQWVDKWVKISLSCEPADFETASAAVCKLYELVRKKRPVVLRMSSPYGAVIGGVMGQLFVKGVRSQVRSVWTQYRGGSLWAGWYSWASFFSEICGLEFASEHDFATDASSLFVN